MTKDPKRVAAGRKSRSKGRRFERQIATALRERFPELAESIRRSIQSRQAEESDVTGIPGLWLECQHATEPTPSKKLAQAIHDVSVAKVKSTPIAITHKTRAKGIFVHMRYSDLLKLTCVNGHTKEKLNMMVTITFNDFLDILEEVKPWEEHNK